MSGRTSECPRVPGSLSLEMASLQAHVLPMGRVACSLPHFRIRCVQWSEQNVSTGNGLQSHLTMPSCYRKGTWAPGWGVKDQDTAQFQDTAKFSLSPVIQVSRSRASILMGFFFFFFSSTIEVKVPFIFSFF